MKTRIFILYVILIAGIASCKKEEASPSACISGPQTVDRGQYSEYSWCGSEVEEVSWSTSFGASGTGNKFTPNFPSIGKHTITVSGKRKGKTASETIEVDYGAFNTIRCTISNDCFNGNQLITSPTGYKGYLYSSLTLCESDLKSGTHLSAIDSVDCKYSSKDATIVAEFKTSAAPGSTLYFSITGPSSESNIGKLCLNTFFPGNPQNGFVVLSAGGESTSTSVDAYSKKLLKGKWKLTYHELNGNNLALQPCNQDDYLAFFMDGSWKFETGQDNCNGTSLPSNGRYNYPFPICMTAGLPSGITMTTLSGPFTGITSAEMSYSQIRVNYQAGTNTGFFRFSYTD